MRLAESMMRTVKRGGLTMNYSFISRKAFLSGMLLIVTLCCCWMAHRLDVNEVW